MSKLLLAETLPHRNTVEKRKEDQIACILLGSAAYNDAEIL
jgi:hypothetical protein